MAEHHQHALPKGYKLGRYSIEAVLGAGGFAITYLAQHTGLGQKVAIKEYLPDEFGLRIEGKTTVRAKRGEEDEFAWGLDRFADEARTLARFNHPGIVPVTDIFEDNGTAYMVMPYQEGESLEERLDRDGTLPEPVLRKIFDPLIDALTLVHASDILHRDIKPANIFIRSNGTPVLLDFGNARQALGTKSQSLTATLTPGYAPNEQYASRGKQGPWTDVYSLGATLYKAVSGDMPPEAPERAMEDSYVPAVAAAEGKYAPALLAAIDKSLAFLPRDRAQDMAEFKLLLGQPRSADEVPPPAKQEAAAATLLAQGQKSTDRQPRIARLKWAMATLLVLTVVGGSYLGWTQYQENVRQQNEIARAKLRAEVAERTKLAAEKAAAIAQAKQKIKVAERAKREAERIAVAKRRETLAAEAKKKAEAISAIRQKVKAFQKKGRYLLKLGKYKRAIVEFDSAISLNSKLAVTYFKRGTAYYWLQRYHRAIRDYDEAIRLDPNDAKPYTWRAFSYRNLKQYRRAIIDYDVAVRLNPRDPFIYSSRGNAYYNLKQFRRAILNYDEAIRLNPKVIPFYEERGFAYQKLKHYRRAISNFDETILRSPKSTRYYLFRGNAYLGWKRYRRAIKDYDVAIRLSPRFSAAYSSRGWAYNGLGQIKKAMGDLRNAVQIDPGNKLARRRLKAIISKAVSIVDAKKRVKMARRNVEKKTSSIRQEARQSASWRNVVCSKSAPSSVRSYLNCAVGVPWGAPKSQIVSILGKPSFEQKRPDITQLSYSRIFQKTNIKLIVSSKSGFFSLRVLSQNQLRNFHIINSARPMNMNIVRSIFKNGKWFSTSQGGRYIYKYRDIEFAFSCNRFRLLVSRGCDYFDIFNYKICKGGLC